MVRSDSRKIKDEDLTKNASQGSINQQILPLIEERILSELPGPPLLRDITTDTRGQPGHVRFDVYQQSEPRLNHFTLVMVWTGRAAFDAYGASAVWRRFMRDVTPLLGSPYDERLYRRLD